MTGPPRVDETGSVVLDYVDGDKCTASGVEKKYTTSVTLACSEEEVCTCMLPFLSNTCDWNSLMTSLFWSVGQLDTAEWRRLYICHYLGDTESMQASQY